MKIGPFGITEIIIILVVVLIIFGPKNLPKLGTAIGKAVKNLREGLGGNKKVAQTEDNIETEGEIEVIEKPEPGKKAAEVTSEVSEKKSVSEATDEEPAKEKAE